MWRNIHMPEKFSTFYTTQASLTKDSTSSSKPYFVYFHSTLYLWYNIGVCKLCIHEKCWFAKPRKEHLSPDRACSSVYPCNRVRTPAGMSTILQPPAAVLRGSQAMSAGSVALFWATLLTCTDVWPSNRHEVLTTVLPAFSLAFGWWCEKAWAEPGCFLSEEGGKKYTPKSLIQRLATAWQDTTEFSVAQIYTVIPKLQTT